MTGKNDTMPQLHEPPFTAEQLKKGNDQSESGYDEISERGTIKKQTIYLLKSINMFLSISFFIGKGSCYTIF